MNVCSEGEIILIKLKTFIPIKKESYKDHTDTEKEESMLFS